MNKKKSTETLKCAICKQNLDVDFVRVAYNGEERWICPHHPRPKKCQTRKENGRV